MKAAIASQLNAMGDTLNKNIESIESLIKSLEGLEEVIKRLSSSEKKDEETIEALKKSKQTIKDSIGQLLNNLKSLFEDHKKLVDSVNE